MFKYFDKEALFANVTFSYLQDFLYYKHKQGLATTTISSYKITIEAIFKFARTGDYSYTPDFNLSDLTVPKYVKSHKEMILNRDENKYLTNEEIRTILEYLDYKLKNRKRGDVRRNIQMIKYIIEFQVLNGMRISELLAIEPSNIDFKKKQLTIDGSIVWMATPNGYGYKDTTKTESGIRVIGLTSRSMDILRKVMLENKKELQWSHDFHDRGFVFTGSTGSPMPKEKVNTLLREAGEWTGIGKTKKVTSHILRHTHVSMLASTGANLKTIMQRVGHTDEKTTLKIYTHVTEKMNNDLMEQLEKENFM